MCSSDIFLAILSILFPPISVWIKRGVCTADSLINIALCCLGYIPGLLHSWYIICKYPEPDYDDPRYEPVPGDARQGRDAERGGVTYYFVSHQSAPRQSSQRGYGTVDSQAPTHSKPAGRSQPAQGDGGAGSSSSGGQQGQGETRPPPTYAEAVKGDNKVQTQD